MDKTQNNLCGIFWGAVNGIQWKQQTLVDYVCSRMALM